MRQLFKILVVLFVISALSVLGLHLFINLKGKSLLVKKLEEATKRKVAIGKVFSSFPNAVYVKDLEIDGLVKIDEVYASGAFFDIVRKSFGLSLLRITNPVISFEKKIPEAVSQGAENKAASPLPGPTQAKLILPPFYIDQLVIREGVLNLVDNLENGEKLAVAVENLSVKIDNLNFSFFGSRIINFDIRGMIPWRQQAAQGKVSIEGWVNFLKKDMQATIDIEDIDAVALQPYYSNWMSLEHARIEKAKLNFTSKINGLNNKIIAPCHMELTDIVFKPRPAEETEQRAEKVANTVIGIFKALNQGKVVLDFTVKTRMDRPEFGFGLIKSAIEDTVATVRKDDKFHTQDVVLFPAKVVQGTVKGVTDMTTAVIGGVYSIGKELGKGFFAVFEKEEEEN